MDFKKELVKELGLGAIAEETMLDDYVKACETIAVRYHETQVKNLGLFSVIGSEFSKKVKIEKCAFCGCTTENRVKIIEHNRKHCENCGNCWG